MDPLCAVSLAGAVAQFVQYSAKLVIVGKEIYSSTGDSVGEIIDIDATLQGLFDIYGNLRYTWPEDPLKRSKEENNLFSLIEQCESIFQELRAVLAKIQLQGDQGKWETLCAAVKDVCGEDQVKGLESRLARIQRQIDNYVISDIR